MSLKAKGVWKSYPQPGASIDVLRGVDFHIKTGETAAIVGQSGAGKSTLLALMAGLDTPSQGSIEVAGQILNEANEVELAKFRAQNLGIIFQQFHLMSSLTALENISLPLEISKQKSKNAVDLARTALDQVGLGERANHFPSELSGGERQRVAIARAFVVKPAILLADEPSGNLDSDTGEKVMDLIFAMTQEIGTTLILVTHNNELSKRCQRKFHLQHGQLQEVN